MGIGKDLMNQIVYTPVPVKKVGYGDLLLEAFGALALAIGLYFWSDYLYGIHDIINLTFARFVRFHMYLVAIRVPYEFYRLIDRIIKDGKKEET